MSPPVGATAAATPLSSTSIIPASPTEPNHGFWRDTYTVNAKIVLNPARVIAPVGTEVVLRAGLCGDDGYLITRQPVQWVLAQESVGTLVTTGAPQGRLWHWWRNPGPQRISGGFAVGETSSSPLVITRGTPSPSDDVQLVEGQTWIAVTSVTEGPSVVSVEAPQIAGVEQRRQTATIHWVDGKWSFPAPAIARAGQPRTLTTHVLRQTSGQPIQGWLVGYQIVGGPPAAFDSSGATAIEVPTDTNGSASVQVIPQTGAAGVTQVRVQVIRTSAAAGDLPRLTVGEGASSVTWSAAGLTVRVSGPSAAELDATIAYRIEVSNSGDASARDVTVSSEIPANLEYVDSTPAAQIFGSRLQWQIPQLDALELKSMEARFRASGSGPARLCATARGSGDLVSEGCAETQITVQPFDINVVPEQEAVEVGQRVRFRVTVTNRGDRPLSNVVVVDRFEAGLRHFDPDNPDAITPSPIERSLLEPPDATLGPGESRQFAVSFVPQRPGLLCHTIEVSSAEGYRASARACITATQPAPTTPGAMPESELQPEPEAPSQASLRVSKRGPENRRVGEAADFVIEVVNDGPTPVTSIRVVDRFDNSLDPKFAEAGVQRDGNQLSWTIPVLRPNQMSRIRINYVCVSENARACNTVTVTAEGGVTQTAEACLNILPGENNATEPVDETAEGSDEAGRRDVDGSDRDDGTSEPRLPRRGQLRVTVADQGDSVRVGEQTTYWVVITNDRDVEDQDVVLTVVLPEEFTFSRSINPPMIQAASSSPDGRTVQFEPVRYLRPGDERTFQIVATAKKAGQGTFRVEVKSLRSETPVTAEETTTVFQE